MNKKALRLNIIIFILECISFLWMFLGINLNSDYLGSTSISSFKYFTVLSNLFVGITSMIYIIYYCTEQKFSNKLQVIRLSSVTSVFLTFIVTMFYLAPLFGKDFIFLYLNNNFFFHLFIPLLSIVSFIFYENNNLLTNKSTMISVIHLIIYGVYYLLNIYIHEGISNITYKYDFYGFTRGNLYNAFIVFPIIIGTFIGLSFILLRFRRLKVGKQKK